MLLSNVYYYSGSYILDFSVKGKLLTIYKNSAEWREKVLNHNHRSTPGVFKLWDRELPFKNYEQKRLINNI